MAGTDGDRLVCRWHDLAVEQHQRPGGKSRGQRVGEDAATLEFGEVLSIQMTRRPLGARLGTPEGLSVEEVLHPVAAILAAVAARWHGRSAFHGAGVLVGGATWLLVGPAGSGKSTLAAVLSSRGYHVTSDDLAVVEGGTVLAGPPTGDLREEASARLGLGERASDLGRPRYRAQLRDAPRETPLAGFIGLRWGEQVELAPMSMNDRLGLLGQNEALGLGPSYPTAFLELLGRPFYWLVRPPSWDALDLTVDQLLRTVGDGGQPPAAR